VAGQPGRRAFCARNLLDPRTADRRLDIYEAVVPPLRSSSIGVGISSLGDREHAE